MFILLLILIFSIILITYQLLKKLNTNIIVIAICTIIIVYFIFFPKQCITSTVAGAKMFFFAVFPSLFPFLIICNILIGYDGIKIYSKLLGRILCRPLRLPLQCSLTLIISSLCGYPLGAKYCCELYENKIISKNTCQRLLNIASNAGPIFVVGTLGTSMLNSKNGGYVLLVSNYISCIIMSLLIKPSDKRDLYNNHNSDIVNSPKNFQNIGNILKVSIDGAIKNTLSIGGYIVLFNVIIELLNSNYVVNLLISSMTNSTITFNLVKDFLLGCLEITKGCQMISLLNIPLNFKYSIIGFLLGFSGLSIISQVYSFAYVFPEISIKLYIKRKALQGFVCALITPIILNLTFKLNISTAVSFQNNNQNNYLLPVVCFLLIMPLLLNGLRKLLHIP